MHAMKTKNTPLRGALAALALAMSTTLGMPLPAWSAAEAAGAPQATAGASQPAQANDGSDYIAAWTVMGEICEVKYPQMKPAIDEFWTTRWNKETRERVAAMKKGPDFQKKVAKHRKNLNERKDEILAQCDKLFMGGAH
jgi:hypothetical protein